MRFEIELNDYDTELWNQILGTEEIEKVREITFLKYTDEGYSEEVAYRYAEAEQKRYAISKAIRKLHKEMRENG